MVSSTQQTLAIGNNIGQVSRPAKALIGWMDQQAALLMMAHGQIPNLENPEHLQTFERARAAVQARASGVDQTQLISDPGAVLAEHIAQFIAQPSFQLFAAEGWSIKIADLSKVCALQPIVFRDHAEERAEKAIPGDMLSLATVTLPISAPAQLPVQFDQQQNTWIIPSRNPNLRIVGPLNAPFKLPSGELVTGCGFFVSVPPSFVQVISYRGRFLLRDGYHRSLGLLARGFSHVPVLYRQFNEFEPLGLGAGMLPEGSYLGDRPPLISDYLIETVSTDVNLPASQKMIVIHGIEMNPIG